MEILIKVIVEHEERKLKNLHKDGTLLPALEDNCFFSTNGMWSDKLFFNKNASLTNTKNTRIVLDNFKHFKQLILYSNLSRCEAVPPSPGTNH